MLEKVRKPAVAGQFYAGNEENLKQTIEECFLDDRGPKSLPQIGSGNKNIKGLVVPHAGYIYSGAIAAHSYNRLSENGFADTFIILGPNHTGMGSGVSVMTEGSWLTPLGKVPINETLGKQLWKNIIDKDENAHLYEHSIEVQLPFLQYIAKDKQFNFVPICMAMQDYQTSDEVGKIIAETVKNSNEKIVIIASTDFSHAGFNYMSMPAEGMRVDEYAQKQDNFAIDQILKMDPNGLIDTVHKNNISMCGYGPVATMLTASKILGANKAELLKYGTSYEVHPSTSCVGYGALAVY
jgi:AmmeMemoRadiSam system protein B